MHGKFEQSQSVFVPRAHALPVLAGAVVSGFLLCAPDARAAGQDAPASSASAVSAAPAPSASPAASAPVAAQPRPAAGQAKIASLTIDGGTVFTQSQMERAMGIGATNWLSWYRHDDNYSSARLARAVSDLRAFYISRGYLRFVVKEVKVTPSDDRKTVAIALTVSEGRLYTMSSVKLGGDPNGLLTAPGMDQALQRALPVGGRITRQGLDAAQRAVLAQLNHDGYARATVTPRFAIDDANGTVALTLAVDRGQQQPGHVRPPEPVSPATRQAATPQADEQGGAQGAAIVPPEAPGQGVGGGVGATASGGATGAQTPGHDQPLAAAPLPGASDAVGAAGEGELDIMGQQQQEGMNLRIGAGYSSSERAFIVGGIRYPNAFGKGWDASADVGFGRTFRELRFSEVDNQFTPSGVSRATTVWYRSDKPFYYLNGSNFRVSGAGVSERFDFPLSAADSVFVAPGFEHDWLGGLYSPGTPVAYQTYTQRVGSALNATTLRAGWTHDMRDSAAMPTSGYVLQSSAEYGIPALGAHYLKLDAGGRYYQPLWGATVLSLSMRGGYGVGWGSKGYPIEKYFYLGGPDTVRGYAVNSLGPRDAATGYPIGGRRMLMGSLEMIQPISRSFVDQGRLVWLLFVDGGNVWSGLPGGQSAGARYSYGTGLGWQMPFGVLKLDFALPVKRYSGDDYQRFQLQFNAGF